MTFLSKIKEGAIQGYHTHKILPSVTAAQAMLESASGKSSLAAKYNNLFGIKASADWNGRIINLPTREHGAGGSYQTNANFRWYDNWSDSMVDHAAFFTNTPWRVENYKHVVGEKDYKKASNALRNAGYATDPLYATKLIRIIEQNSLTAWDTEAFNGKPSNATTIKKTVGGNLSESAKSGIGTYNVTLIGDSLGVGTHPHLSNAFKSFNHDVLGSRQITHATNSLNGTHVLQSLKDYGQLKDIVVVVLGTNRGVLDSEVDNFVSIAGSSRKVVFVDTNSAVNHKGSVASAYKRASEKHSNVFYANWSVYSNSLRSRYYGSDDIHMTSEGYKAHANFIKQAVYEASIGVKTSSALGTSAPTEYYSISDIVYDTDGLTSSAGESIIYNREANKRWGQRFGGKEIWLESRLEMETDNPEELLAEGVRVMKANSAPAVQYVVDLAELPPGISIGDTGIFIDHEFNPPAYIEARVLEIITSETDPNGNKAVIGNAIELFPLEKGDIIRLQNELKNVRDNLVEDYRKQQGMMVVLDSSNGNVLGDRYNETELVARLTQGTKDLTNKVVTYTWERSSTDSESDEIYNVAIETEKTSRLVITSKDISNNLSTFTARAYDGETLVNQSSITIKNADTALWTDTSVEPEDAKDGATWVDEDGKQWIKKDGEWEERVDQAQLTSVRSDVEGAITEAEEAKQAAQEAYTDAVTEAERLVTETDTVWQGKMEDYDEQVGNIEAEAQSAKTKADQALQEAGISTDLAQTAKELSETAKANAQTALSNSSTAISNAGQAISDALTAKGNAQTALTNAQTALSTAGSADSKAGQAIAKANAIPTTITDIIADKNLVNGNYVDTKVDSATGAWSQELVRVEGLVPRSYENKNLLLNSVGLDFNARTGTKTILDNYEGITNAIKIENPTTGMYTVPTESYSEQAILGEDYTLSFLFRYEGVKGTTATAYIGPGGYREVQGIGEAGVWTRVYVNYPKVNTTARRIHLTFSGYETIYISSFKLEKGLVATDWTPAPEDSYSKEDFKLFNAKYTQDVTGMTGRLTTVENTKLNDSTFQTFKQTEYQVTADKVSNTMTRVDTAEGKITTQGTAISQQAGLIASKAEKTVVDTLSGTVSNQGTLITQNATAIKSKAESSLVNTIKGTVDTHTTEISQNATEIANKASSTSVNTLTGRVSTAETTITQHATAITSKASQTEVDTVKDTVSDHTSTLSQQATQISARLTSTQVNSLVDGKGLAPVTYVDNQITATAEGFGVELTKVENKIPSLNGLATQTWTSNQISTTADSISSTISHIERKVNDIEVGGRNLTIEKNFLNNKTSSSVGLSKFGYLLSKNKKSIAVELESNQKYTLGFLGHNEGTAQNVTVDITGTVSDTKNFNVIKGSNKYNWIFNTGDLQETEGKTYPLKSVESWTRYYKKSPGIVTNPSDPVYNKWGFSGVPLANMDQVIGGVFGSAFPMNGNIQGGIDTPATAWAGINMSKLYFETNDPAILPKIRAIGDFFVNNVIDIDIWELPLKAFPSAFIFNEVTREWAPNTRFIHTRTFYHVAWALLEIYDVTKDSKYSNLAGELLDGITMQQLMATGQSSSGELPPYFSGAMFNTINNAYGTSYEPDWTTFTNTNGDVVVKATKKWIELFGNTTRTTFDLYEWADVYYTVKSIADNYINHLVYLYNNQELRKPDGHNLLYCFSHYEWEDAPHPNGYMVPIPMNWDFINEDFGKDQWFTGDLMFWAIIGFAEAGKEEIANSLLDRYYEMRAPDLEGRLLFHDRYTANGTPLVEDTSKSITFTALYMQARNILGNHQFDLESLSSLSHYQKESAFNTVDGSFSWDTEDYNSVIENKSLGEIIYSIMGNASKSKPPVIISFENFTTNSVHILDIMLERGTQPSDWQPAPEDMATTTALTQSIQDLYGFKTTVQNTYGTKTEVSVVSQKAGEINQLITEVKNDPANAITGYNSLTNNVNSMVQAIGTDGGKIAQMVMTDSLFQTQVGNIADETSKMTQLSDSWVMTLKSGNDIKTQINATTNGIRLKADLIHLSGTSLIDNATIKSAHIDNLNANKIVGNTADFNTIRTGVLVADAVDSTHITSDNALIDKLFATSALIDRLTSKTAFISQLKAIDLVADKASFVKAGWQALNSNAVIDGTRMRVQNTDGDFIELNNSPELRSDDASGTAVVLGKGRVHFYDSAGNSKGYVGTDIHTSGNRDFGTFLSKGGGTYRFARMAGAKSLTYDTYTVRAGRTNRVAIIEDMVRAGLLPDGNSAQFAQKSDMIAKFHGWSVLPADWPTQQAGNQIRYREKSVATTGDSYQTIWKAGVSSGDTWKVWFSDAVVFEGGYTQSSDRRLKHDIEASHITALDHIESLAFKQFKWNKDGQKEPLGIIAQDSGLIRKVGGTEEEMEGVDGFRATILALKGVQELNKVVKEQAEKIKQLEEIINQ